MAKDREGIDIDTMNRVHRTRPVFYASLPLDTETLHGRIANEEETKDRLVSILWGRLVAMDSGVQTECVTRRMLPPKSAHRSAGILPASHRCGAWESSRGLESSQDACATTVRATLPLRVIHDSLGKPRLLVGDHRGPAISFSEGGGRIWAALCGDGSDIGIDVAEAAEFQGDYPRHRVFHAEELEHALAWAGGDLARASALLWSVKEAVVKSLGCAFHFVDPLQVHVYPNSGRDGEGGGSAHTSSVRLSGRALQRFPEGAVLSPGVRSFPLEGMWLSIAVSNSHVDAVMAESVPGACSCLAGPQETPHWRPQSNRGGGLL